MFIFCIFCKNSYFCRLFYGCQQEKFTKTWWTDFGPRNDPFPSFPFFFFLLKKKQRNRFSSSKMLILGKYMTHSYHFRHNKKCSKKSKSHFHQLFDACNQVQSLERYPVPGIRKVLSMDQLVWDRGAEQCYYFFIIMSLYMFPMLECHPLITAGRHGIVTTSISFANKWSLEPQNEACPKMLQVLQFVTI